MAVDPATRPYFFTPMPSSVMVHFHQKQCDTNQGGNADLMRRLRMDWRREGSDPEWLPIASLEIADQVRDYAYRPVASGTWQRLFREIAAGFPKDTPRQQPALL